MKKITKNPFEGFENLNKIKFIKTEKNMEQTILQQRIAEGIRVISVALPKNYNPNRTKSEAFDWLEKTVNSTKRASYIYKSKYSVD
jgi:hypothetical protein